MSMHSIWEDTAKRLHFAPLQDNKSTDVLIIGGGITGILCAYKLKNAGVNCMLTEATEICGGITKGTTAKITLQHGLIYDKTIKRFGEEKAQIYVKAQMKACKEYARLSKKIDCDYEQKDSFVYSLHDRNKIENEVVALKRLGVKSDFSDEVELPFKVAGAICLKNQAQFHPLKFLCTIAKDLPIY